MSATSTEHSETWTVVEYRGRHFWTRPDWFKRESILTGPGLGSAYWAKDYPVGATITIRSTVSIKNPGA